MSSTNKTTYYDLPQFVDSDLFNPLVDDNDAYDKIDTALHNIAEAEAGDASEIVAVKGRVTTAEDKIEALETQNGNEVLATTAQTLSGAVNELDTDIASLDGRVNIVEDDINNVNTGLKVKVDSLGTRMTTAEGDIDAIEAQNGDEALATTAQTLSSGINELCMANKLTNKMINANLLLDGFTDDTYGLQGGVYVGDNKIVVYHATSDNINGILECYNILTHSKLWSYPIVGYHGNSIAYRPTNDMLYIASGTHVVTVKLSNPSVVVEDITPVVTCTNLCYDANDDVFYGGATTANIQKLNVALTSVLDTIPIDVSNLRDISIIFNNFVCCVNDVIFGFGVLKDASFICGFNKNNGKLSYLAEIEEVINGYRVLGEIEFITYDNVNDRFLLGSTIASTVCGVYQKNLFNIAEIGMYKRVPEAKPFNIDNLTGTLTFTVEGRVPAIICQGTDELTPWNPLDLSHYKCLRDVLTVQRNVKKPFDCNFATSYNGVREIGDFDLRGFYGKISGGDTITVHNLHIGNSDVVFKNCHFVDSKVIDTTKQSNIFTGAQSVIHFESCEFDDFTQESGVTSAVHVQVGEYSIATDNDTCIYNGTKSKYAKEYGGNFYFKAGVQLLSDYNNNQAYTGGGSFEKSNITITVPTGKRYIVEVDVNVGGGSAYPTGIAITADSVTSLNSHYTNCEYVFDGDTDMVTRTPMMLLPAGTYAIWIKRIANYANGTINFHLRDVT